MKLSHNLYCIFCAPPISDFDSNWFGCAYYQMGIVGIKLLSIDELLTVVFKLVPIFLALGHVKQYCDLKML